MFTILEKQDGDLKLLISHILFTFFHPILMKF